MHVNRIRISDRIRCRNGKAAKAPDRAGAVGAPVVSPAFQRGVPAPRMGASPVGRRKSISTEDISRIVFDPAITQQRGELFLKALLAVMLLLALDVRLDHGDLRRTDAECALAFLPREALPHPM